MNKIALTLTVTFCLTTAFAAATNATKHVKLSTEARQQQLMEKVGGMLVLPRTGKVVIFNAQTRLPLANIEKRNIFLSKALNANVSVAPCQGFSFANAEQTMRIAKANVAVFLIDDSSLPMSLTAIEGPWAIINMDKLANDNPAGDVLQSRYNAELNRVVDSLLGIGGQGSGLGPKSTVPAKVAKAPRIGSDLDELTNIGFSMDTALAIFKTLSSWGVLPERKSTYKRACQQGWAPAPTNEWQKAVWDKVHALPIEPIKIKPEAKKVEK